MEICIAVADWARGRTAWDPSLPGGAGTGATTDSASITTANGSGMISMISRSRRAGVVAAWG
ncbi:hypothetical protein [Streptomyces tremellae]|uniref:Uncharacterized protein n=1 Tax=Streptomyces tremellae TaxID=1124239 RepID=A0ABP7G8U0_9ACTN